MTKQELLKLIEDSLWESDLSGDFLQAVVIDGEAVEVLDQEANKFVITVEEQG